MENRYRREYVDELQLESEWIPGGIIVYYADGNEEIIHVNRCVVDMVECDDVEDFLEFVHGSFRGFVHPDELDAVEESIWSQMSSDSFDHVYYRVRTKSGRVINVIDYGKLCTGSDGRPIFYAFVAELKGRDSIDWLTGLPSMGRFHELAQMGAYRLWLRGQRPAAIAMDLAGMKSYNAQYGRDEGDRLLRCFADVLRKRFGPESCSRFSEDHFYAFCPVNEAEDCLRAVFDDFKSANEGKTLPVKAGICECAGDDDIVATGFDRAKFACDLYRDASKSRMTWFSDEMRAKDQLRRHIIDSVDRAIEEGWIHACYQAVIRSSTGYVCGEEALARWSDPEYGELSPADFIPVLEGAGLLHKLDMHIVDCVLADMQRKRENDMQLLPISVNISLKDLDALDVAEEIMKRADEANITHDRLRIEFTESAASDNPEYLKQQIAKLHEAGFEVWMDDFGSGYSSLNTLQQYDFDVVKLDMEFIRDVSNGKACEIVSGVIQAAKRLGVRSLAEGVESEEQALFLESVGCDMVQGFFHAFPISFDELCVAIESGNEKPFEAPGEFEYWNAVCAIDLDDPVASLDELMPPTIMDMSFPAGVLECRDGKWLVLRANKAYRDIIARDGFVVPSRSMLEAIPIEGSFEPEFYDSVARSDASQAWEQISGKMDYGSKLQFYIKPISETEHARAYRIAAIPNMLGAVLGGYGDVPVAYAIFRVLLDESRQRMVDAEFVYANETYCEWTHVEQEKVFGRSYLAAMRSTSPHWFPHCYRAAVLKERVTDTLYSPEIGHWISFSVAPSRVDGCCVFAFTIVDQEQSERADMIVGRNTSDLIIDIASVLSSEKDYDAAMDSALAMVSNIINPKSVFVYERGIESPGVTHEWHIEGMPPQVGMVYAFDSSDFEAWDRLAEGGSVVYVNDVELLGLTDPWLKQHLIDRGVSRILAATLRSDDECVGYLVAEDYVLDSAFETGRLLETVAPFASARIASHRLEMGLQWAGTHDALTGLLNRRGFDEAVAEHMTAYPDDPYTLALMDIDDFKTINDLHGHDVGDEALRTLALVVSEKVPEGAIVGRSGGDEFVAIAFGELTGSLSASFDAIVSSDLHCEHGGSCYALSMSIGYAEVPSQAADLADASTKADAALYAVKLAGKGGVRRYSVEIESQYRSQLGFTPREIAENVPGAVMVHRASDVGEILFANDELVEMFECDDLPDFMEYTSGVFDGVVHPDDRRRVFQELKSQIDFDVIGPKNFADFRILTKTGKVKNVSDSGRAVEVAGVGKAFYVLLIDKDERMQALEKYCGGAE